MKPNEEQNKSVEMKDNKSKYSLGEIKAVYEQGADCCDTEHQYLEVMTQDGGGGIYFVIKTERWAFDNIDEIINILNDFKAKL